VDVTPDLEVNTTEVIATLKLIMPRFAGRVSETSTRLTFALLPPPPPPPPEPLGRPLQDDRAKAAAKVIKIKDLVYFIEYPTRMNVQNPALSKSIERNPKLGFYAEE